MAQRIRRARISTVQRAGMLTAALLLTLATAGSAALSWKPLPPFGGPVTALAAAGSTDLIYAGTETAGSLRSRDGGVTWIPSDQVPSGVRLLKLKVDLRDPRMVFAAARFFNEDSAGVLRSLDGGAHWQPVNHGLGDDRPLYAQDLATDPSDRQKLYAATEDGLFQTRDRGASWQRIGLAGSGILAVAADPFRPGTLFVSAYRTAPEILMSTDGGATWRPSGQGIEGQPVFTGLAFDTVIPGKLFVFGNGWPIHVSRDGGATWTNTGPPLASLAFGPAGLLFGPPYEGDGVLKSTDGGLHWSPTGPLPDHVTQVLAANGRLYAAGRRGVWASSDNGAHWRPSSRGLSARTVGDLTQSGGVLYASFAEGVLASGSGGTSWRQLTDAAPAAGSDAHIVRFLAAGLGVLYALEAKGEFGDIISFVRSTDRGVTWSEITDPRLGGTFTSLAVDPRHPQRLYAGSVENSGNDHPPCHLERSSDGGSSWSCITLEGSVSKITVEPATSTPYLIAGGTVFILAGATPHLEFRGAGLSVGRTHDFAFDPQQTGTLYAAADTGVFKTVNGGRSWTRASQGLPAGGEAFSVAVDPHRKDAVYAGLIGQVYRSLDAGRTWTRLGNGLPADAPVTALLADSANPRRLYAVAAGRGLFVQDSTVP
jgi:photosystem II stability/assembly factor-like uncharacterized protein